MSKYFNKIILVFSFLICVIYAIEDEDVEEAPEIGSMQDYPGGPFYMGTSDEKGKQTGEYPIRIEKTKPFRMDRYPVTNAEFAEFVRRTRFYFTQADKKQFSYVFYSHVNHGSQKVVGEELSSEPWWIPVYLARWDRPYGPQSTLSGLENHPVVHVSLYDASAYCGWKGKRLPTEYEWEYAVRADNKTWRFPWGDGTRRKRMNSWHGNFPSKDEGWDGYKGLSPVNAFPSQNRANMFDMLGNAWEWTETWWNERDNRDERVVLKGGSFTESLNEEMTLSLRCSIRTGRKATYTGGNIGFRCAETIIPPSPTTPKPRLLRYEDTWHYKEEMRRLSEVYKRLAKNNRDTLRFTFKEDL